MSYAYTNQAAIRRAFWEGFQDVPCRKGPRGRILSQNEQPADTRMAFCDFVDQLAREGSISESLAQRVTL